MITLGIIDDHSLILHGLQFMLNEQDTCQISFMVHTAQDLKTKLATSIPDVLLMDIELSDDNGPDLCKEILNLYPSIKIIALTNHDETIWVRKMLRSGASGYLLKGTDRATLLKAIEEVYSGSQYLDPQVERAIFNQTIGGKKNSFQEKLTRRETEILGLIANEYTNQEIADKLFISIRTVETHRSTINQKLDIKNMAGLVKEAMLRGLA